MAMSVVYTTVNGQILRENRGGVVSDFVPDPLGSVVMVQDAAGAAVYRAEYGPYGNLQSESGTNPSSLGFVGTLGYIKDSATSMYVRARYLLANLGRWLTKDPLWPEEPGYVYAGAAPNMWVDRDGLQVVINPPPPRWPWERPKPLDQCLAALRKYFSCLNDLRNEWAKYDPISDAIGGVPYAPGKCTVPFGHFEEIINLQRCVANSMYFIQRHCGSHFPPPGLDPGVMRWPVRLPKPRPRQMVQVCYPVTFTPSKEACDAGALAATLFVCYWVISIGSRILCPPRNLIPIL